MGFLFCFVLFRFVLFLFCLFYIGLSPWREPFLMLNVPTSSQLIQFELIKPTGVLDRPGGRYEFKFFSVCSQAVR